MDNKQDVEVGVKMEKWDSTCQKDVRIGYGIQIYYVLDWTPLIVQS